MSLFRNPFQNAHLRAIDASPKTLALLRPLEGPLTYMGQWIRGRRVPVYAFFDHTCRSTPYPYRFAITTCQDWRGGQLTYDKHWGTDLIVPPSTAVVAAASGIVTAVGSEPVGGAYVWIDHGGGYATTYHHLSQPLVSPGKKVSRGELIAKSGAAGLAIQNFFPLVPPHLHFSLFVDGVPVDPFRGWDSPGYWADLEPRPYDGHSALDLDLPYESLVKEDLLKGFEQDPLLRNNFYDLLDSLAPEQMSFGGDCWNLSDRPRLRLSLPFHREDVSGLVYP